MSDRYRFACRSCEMDFVIDAGVRADFLECGCPLCGTATTEADFEEVSGEQEKH